MGEGHHKVLSRMLCYVVGLPVGRNRILRLMRLHHLLSPHRTRTKPAKAHDGRICTDASNLLRATDGARLWSNEDGWFAPRYQHGAITNPLPP